MKTSIKDTQINFAEYEPNCAYTRPRLSFQKVLRFCVSDKYIDLGPITCIYKLLLKKSEYYIC